MGSSATRLILGRQQQRCVCLGTALAVASALLLPAASGAQVPFPGAAGADAFDSSMSVELILGTTQTTLQLSGPTAVLLGAPQIDGDHCVIDTEIVSLNLSSTDPVLGEVRVKINPERSSRGEVRSQGPDCFFPADSFFDVFVVVEVGILGEDLVNQEPVRVEALNLKALPPLFDTYTHPPPAIPLVGRVLGQPVAMIGGGSTHRPEQLPTFSVDDATSSLDPAALLQIGNPPLARLRAIDLGLAAGDDIDALSFGLDSFGDRASTTVAFSVDPNAMGAANTGVNREAANDEAEGDEFVSQFNNTNAQLVDEQVWVLNPGPPSEDLDALVDQPPSTIDSDGDMVPNRPVFFSLQSGSPSLAAIAGATPASILAKNGAAPPFVFASEARMGLRAGDDVDALCLMKSALPSTTVRPGAGPPAAPRPGNATTDYALFSLAPGSPTLTMIGASPGDLLITDFSGLTIPVPPSRYATAGQIGLLPSDNLNALKCLKPVVLIPFSGCVVVGGKLVINVGGAGHSGDPFDEERGYDFWKSLDPQTGHSDGPFAVPEASDNCGLEEIDPASLGWVFSPGDRCGAPHLHGSRFGHADPNPPACGHGLFLALTGTAFSVTEGLCAAEVAAAAAEAFNATDLFHDSGFSASSHVVDNPAVAASPLATRGSTAPQPQAVLILTGVGPTNLGIQSLGVEGLAVGPPVGSLPLPLVAAEACVGDCDGSGSVTVDELVTLVNIALGSQPITRCTAGDRDANGAITVDEIVAAVGNALEGCRSGS